MSIIYREPISSFATTADLENVQPSQRRAGKQIYANVIKDTVLVDKITIQQRTQLTANVKVLLPFRPVIFIDGTAATEDKAKLPLVSLPTTLQWYSLYNERRVLAKVIDSRHMIPGHTFTIDGRLVHIEDEYQSVNIIASCDFFVNIADKKLAAKNLDVGQFSYRSTHYKHAFSEYALTLPFSQSILLQLVPLGCKLNSTEFPSVADLALPSSFADLNYCGINRSCNGGPMTGVSDTPYAFNREDYYYRLFMDVNRLLTKRNDNVSSIMRTLINQRSQFADSIAVTGLFMVSGQAYVADTASSFKIPATRIQNELPHELGHTYGLADYSGDGIQEKLLHYSVRRDLQLIIPFMKDTYECTRGSMNEGKGNETYEYYTRLNRYSTMQAYANVVNGNKDLPNKFWQNINNSKMRTILMVLNGSVDYTGFMINAYAPLTPLLTTAPLSGQFVELRKYWRTHEKQKFYIDTTRNSRFTLAYEWLNNADATFVLIYKGISKRFYLSDDGRNIPAPFSAIYPALYKQLDNRLDNGNLSIWSKQLFSKF